MDEVSILWSESLIKYFQVITKTGYKNYKDVYKLIALSAINYIINEYGDYTMEYSSDEDLRALHNALYCISGNCLIDYPRYLSEDTIFHKIDREKIFRTTEKEITRVSEDSLFRSVNSKIKQSVNYN